GISRSWRHRPPGPTARASGVRHGGARLSARRRLPSSGSVAASRSSRTAHEHPQRPARSAGMKHPAASASDTDITVAEYVCGLLDADERAQVHGLLARDDEALKQALAWEERLLALVDALPRVTPAPALRERLQRTLGIGPPPAEQPPPPPQLLRQRSEDAATRSASSPVKPAATAPAPTVATPVRSDARPEVAPAASNLEPVADAPPSSHAAPPS